MTSTTTTTDIEAPRGGLRAPCPCGSGKRYKQCHGRVRPRAAFVPRPFEGVPRETDIVAFREIVPAATMEGTTTGGVPVTVATVLPMAWPALRRPDGSVMLGVQTTGGSVDLSHDLGAALAAALAAEPATPITHVDLALDRGTDTGADGSRLQDLVESLDPPVVHDGFAFWVQGWGEDDEIGAPGTLAAIGSTIEQADASIVPTEAVDGVDSAYWVRLGATTFVRWIVPFPEDTFMDGIARLHAARSGSDLGEGTRFAGAFRAHGLLVPVWDMGAAAGADSCAAPLAAFAERIEGAMADDTPLSADERRAKAGLVSRQVTLR